MKHLTQILMVMVALGSCIVASANDSVQVHYLYDAQSGERFLGLGVSNTDRQAVDEGVAFSVSQAPSPGLVGLYRCVSKQDHHRFVSEQVGCGGDKTESLLGYVTQNESIPSLK